MNKIDNNNNNKKNNFCNPDGSHLPQINKNNKDEDNNSSSSSSSSSNNNNNSGSSSSGSSSSGSSSSSNDNTCDNNYNKAVLDCPSYPATAFVKKPCPFPLLKTALHYQCNLITIMMTNVPSNFSKSVCT